MNVGITGSSGFIGSALCQALDGAGQHVVPLARRPTAADLDGLDAVVHLAGEPIAQRWTPAVKAEIRDSRVLGTRHLADRLAELARPPRVLVSASAMGYYGHRPGEVLTEESPPGTGFLADVCRDWEAATAPAEAAGIRVIHLRSALVLGPGGALARMLPIFKLGLGGPLGDGSQIWSWIDRDDHVRAVMFAIENPELRGPLNMVAPGAVSNAEFTRELARAVRRPAVLRVPRLAARLVMGELADSLFWSARLVPAKLDAAGFHWVRPDLAASLEHHVLALA